MALNTISLLLLVFQLALVGCLSLSSSMKRHVVERFVVRVEEKVWRQAAWLHRNKIRELLQPGLTPLDHPVNVGQRFSQAPHDGFTALDRTNPVFNFMIEYYGLKGAKGPRRLAKWCPNPALLLLNNDRITTIQDLIMEGASSSLPDENNSVLQQVSERSIRSGEAILLEGASENDLGSLLYGKGAVIEEDGISYSPSFFYNRNDPSQREANARSANAYLWYRSVLQQTLQAEPILHCHGLHEWAMQYHPEGSEAPPSAKYQQHLPLRVSRQVINEAVERRGISCTHVDALRFFAPAAKPLNHCGASLERIDQLRLEQPACVHAHMDLLKMALRLQPFVGSNLIVRVLEIALEARKLDVAASPYDASAYGVGVVPVEHKEGRQEYRRQQTALMHRAKVVRKELLDAYDVLIHLAFDDSVLSMGKWRSPSVTQQSNAF